MNESLRALIVDDSPRDAMMLERALRSRWADLVSSRVDTEEEMRNALHSDDWDVIISDEVMPVFDAAGALRVLHETNRDIPFIVCSGVMVTQDAIELMKQGAGDFVRKDDLARMAPAVERELQQAETRRQRRQAEESLRESEAFNRAIIESSQDCISVIDSEGLLNYMNVGGQHLMGIPRIQDYLDRPWVEFWQEGYQFLARQAITTALKGEFSHFQAVAMNTGEGSEWWDVVITRLPPSRNRSGSLLAVARDITLTKRMEQEQRQQDARLQEALLQTIAVTARTIEKRDPFTAGHQQRVSGLVVRIARQMGLKTDRITGLKLGALIHDIGKISIPSEVLVRPGELTDTEFSLVKDHCELGYDILKDVDLPWPVADLIYHHHERLDGSGYPQGLKGDQISMEARILAVADMVEAMSSHRPYRHAFEMTRVREEIINQQGKQLDGDVVDACIRVLDEEFDFDKDDTSLSDNFG
ncbi:MAG: HD domain-containing phosphohydrolase [Sedimenticola sp.]